MPWIGGKSYGSKRDHNHATITRCFILFGYSVADCSGVGRGFPDLLVGGNGHDYKVEVKNPRTGYGKRGLSESQKNFAKWWNGDPEVYVVKTVEDVEKLVEEWKKCDSGLPKPG